MSAWLARLHSKKEVPPEPPLAAPSLVVDPDLKEGEETDASTFSLLRNILDALKELGGIKPFQAAVSMYFLLNHPEISQAVEEEVKGDPEVPLPAATDLHCQMAVAAYAKNEKNLLAALGEGYTADDIIFAQYAANGLLPAHMVIWHEATNTLYVCVRGTADWRDAVKDLAGGSIPFLDSTAHAGMAAAANAFFSSKYTTAFTSKCKWLQPKKEPTAAVATAETAVSLPISTTVDDPLEDPSVMPSITAAAVAVKTAPAEEAETTHSHGGLLEVVQLLWQKKPTARIMFAGHSLGAATAALACCKLRALLVTKDERLEPGEAGAGARTAEVELISKCTYDVSAFLFATPACAAPEIALAAEAPLPTCPFGATPIIQSVILADDFVPRLTIATVKVLHDKLADPVLAQAANAEFYSDAKDASFAALSKFWDNVSGGKEGKIQTAGRYIADGVSAFLDSPKVAQVTTAVADTVTAAWRKWNKGVRADEMSVAYETLGAAPVAASAEASTTVARPALVVDPDVHPKEPLARPAEPELSPLLSPRMLGVCRAFRAESCVPTQSLVIPGCIYHVTRVHQPAETAAKNPVGGAASTCAANGVGHPTKNEKTVSTPVHRALQDNVATAEAVDVEKSTSSAKVVKEVEARLAAGDFRVHRVPPARFGSIRISNAMLHDHKKKRYLVTCEAVCLDQKSKASSVGGPL